MNTLIYTVKIHFVAFIATSFISTVASAPRVMQHEWPSYYIFEPNGPDTYAFGYEIDDPLTGNKQFKNEEKYANGTVSGSFGSVRPDGILEITRYEADEQGYRSSLEEIVAPRGVQAINENHSRPSSSPLTKGIPLQEIEEELMISPELQFLLSQHDDYLSPHDTADTIRNQNPNILTRPDVGPQLLVNNQENDFFLPNSKLDNFFNSPYYQMDNYWPQDADLSDNEKQLLAQARTAARP